MKKVWLVGVAILLLVGCSAKVSSLLTKENDDYLILEGDIQNNIISTTSTVPGKIIEMQKQQGEPVEKGEMIAVIDNTNQQFAVDQLQAVVDMKKAKLEELKAGTRPQQLEQAEAQARAAKAQLDLLKTGTRDEQIEQAKNNVKIAEEAVHSAEISYNHIKSQFDKLVVLYDAGAATKHEYDEVKYNFDTATNKLSTHQYQLDNAKQQLTLLEKGPTLQEIKAAEANYEAATAQLNLLKSGATEQTIQAAEADLIQAIAQLNQAKKILSDTRITALADGMIISKNYELGDVVNIGSNIADIAVKEDVYVLCYLPNEYLDSVYYNQEVTVTTSTGEQIARVSYIDLHHEYTPKDQQSTSDGKRIATKIKVAINDEGGKLKTGMKAEVKIPLNEYSLKQ